MRKTLVGTVAVLAASIGLAGCGAGPLQLTGSAQSGPTGSASQSPPTKTVVETVPEQPASDSQAAGSQVSDSETSPPESTVVEDDEGVINPCQTSDLEVIFESAEYFESGGDGYGLLTVTNTGGEACSLDGYPTVHMMSSGIREIPTTNSHVRPDPSFVSIGPGAEATAKVEWWVYPYKETDTGCVERPAGLVVTLPGQPTPDNGIPLEVPVNTPDGKTPMGPCNNGDLEVGAFEQA